MDGVFLKEAALDRPALFKAITAFNMRYAVPRSLPESLAGLGVTGDALWKDGDIRRLFAAPDIRGWWDFAHEPNRLALPEPAVLMQTCRYFSGAILSEEISHVVQREPLLELRRQMGADLHAYALRRGRYQAGSLVEAFSPLAGEGTLGEKVERLAWSALYLAADAWTGGLRNFLRNRDPEYFAFPESVDGSAPTGTQAGGGRFLTAEQKGALDTLGRAEKRSLWFALKKILLREVAQEWAPCFD